ncbi:unnamed protein product [Ilex paraguariensis]|uniref:Uncharacterized protein n=1 Tax=Ilex paraguariensis TaxID=185542 RepID=A0ABC8V4B1_9AQUA
MVQAALPWMKVLPGRLTFGGFGDGLVLLSLVFLFHLRIHFALVSYILHLSCEVMLDFVICTSSHTALTKVSKRCIHGKLGASVSFPGVFMWCIMLDSLYIYVVKGSWSLSSFLIIGCIKSGNGHLWASRVYASLEACNISSSIIN